MRGRWRAAAAACAGLSAARTSHSLIVWSLAFEMRCVPLPLAQMWVRPSVWPACCASRLRALLLCVALLLLRVCVRVCVCVCACARVRVLEHSRAPQHRPQHAARCRRRPPPPPPPPRTAMTAACRCSRTHPRAPRAAAAGRRRRCCCGRARPRRAPCRRRCRTPAGAGWRPTGRPAVAAHRGVRVCARVRVCGWWWRRSSHSVIHVVTTWLM
jgi:hypothetical protein